MDRVALANGKGYVDAHGFICGACGRRFRSEGGLNLHYRTHKAKQRPQEDAPARPEACAGADKCAWRLLRRGALDEAAALADGYRQVCDTCLALK